MVPTTGIFLVSTRVLIHCRVSGEGQHSLWDCGTIPYIYCKKTFTGRPKGSHPGRFLEWKTPKVRGADHEKRMLSIDSESTQALPKPCLACFASSRCHPSVALFSLVLWPWPFDNLLSCESVSQHSLHESPMLGFVLIVFNGLCHCASAFWCCLYVVPAFLYHQSQNQDACKNRTV